MKLSITIEGDTTSDLVLAMEVIASKIAHDFTSGFDRNESGNYTFEIDPDAPTSGAKAPYLVTNLSKLTGVTEADGQFSLAFEVGPSPVFTDLGEGATGRALIYIDAADAAGAMRAIAAHFGVEVP